MSKKDYELIADSINLTYLNLLDRRVDEHQSCTHDAMTRLIISLAHDLARTNPRFQSERFIAWATRNAR